MGRRSIKVLPPGAAELLSNQEEFTRFIHTTSSHRIIRDAVDKLEQRMMYGVASVQSDEEYAHFETALRRTCIVLVVEDVVTTVVGRTLDMFEVNKRGATPRERDRLQNKLVDMFSNMGSAAVGAEMQTRRLSRQFMNG